VGLALGFAPFGHVLCKEVQTERDQTAYGVRKKTGPSWVAPGLKQSLTGDEDSHVRYGGKGFSGSSWCQLPFKAQTPY